MTAIVDAARAYKDGEINWAQLTDDLRAFPWVARPERTGTFGDDGDLHTPDSIDDLYDARARGLLSAAELEQALDIAVTALRRTRA